MPGDCLALADILLTKRPQDNAMAFYNKQYVFADTFTASVSQWATQLHAQPSPRFALYTGEAYPFAVLLLALFHAGKEVWVPGNNRPGTAELLQQAGCQLIGAWDSAQPYAYQLTDSTDKTFALAPINPKEATVVIFTSGATGQPKPIIKRLIQLQNEIAVLEVLWGKQLGGSEIVSTVSHQHIYGLLFRVLWPLSAGRCFHSPIYLNPEILVNNIKDYPACWVASPAHLKRLDGDSPWDGIGKMSAIFSSGGAMPAASKQQIKSSSGQQPIEIYGSSETGGIGWRQQDEAWTLFPDMELKESDKRWQLRSPYIFDADYYDLDDLLTLLPDGRFKLLGRTDRIVKIEEKRLSLTELEQHLIANPLISEAHTLVISNNRDVIAAVVALSNAGLAYQADKGRNSLIKCLRANLEQWFETVLLPKKWLFVNTLPLTAQGKIDQGLLAGLLEADRRKLPQAIGLIRETGHIQLTVKVPQVHELTYFPDHFPGTPILPGVVQLAWAEHFGKLCFGFACPTQTFTRLEVVKFVRIICPGDELTLTLIWKAESGELCFNFSSGLQAYSSGRMVYMASSATSCPAGVPI